MTIMLLKMTEIFFAKANYQIANKLSLFGDLQLRNVHYKAEMWLKLISLIPRRV
jgi:hypothetical protein